MLFRNTEALTFACLSCCYAVESNFLLSTMEAQETDFLTFYDSEGIALVVGFRVMLIGIRLVRVAFSENLIQVLLFASVSGSEWSHCFD